jgi:hypothetical protein
MTNNDSDSDADYQALALKNITLAANAASVPSLEQAYLARAQIYATLEVAKQLKQMNVEGLRVEKV